MSSAAMTPARRLSNIIGGSAGNLVEWFDWFAYTAFTVYFAPIFSPKGDSTAQLLSAAAVFAVGFLTRPVGAWVTGVYSDRRGRKAELFPAHIRALGVALPYAIANALFGGTAEYAALWFKGEGMESAYFWYVTALIGVSLLTYIRTRNKGHNSLITHD